LGYPNFGFIGSPASTLAIQLLASLFPEEYRLLVTKMVDARKRARMTQTDLAKALGRPQSFVSKYESGERRLDPVEFVRISQMLNSDPFKALSSSIGGVGKRPNRTRRGYE
jgi:transcriptional regulator with XRE-family HTH domain